MDTRVWEHADQGPYAEAVWRLDFIKTDLKLIGVLQAALSARSGSKTEDMAEILNKISDSDIQTEMDDIDPYIQLEFEDHYAKKYLEGLIGIELYCENQKHEYASDAGIESDDPDDVVLKAIESQKSIARAHLLKSLQKRSRNQTTTLAKPFGQLIDPINDFEESDTAIYAGLAKYVIEKCAKDDYMIELFEQFEPEQGEPGSVLWKEKILRYAEQHFAPEETNPYAQEAVTEWEKYLYDIYGDLGLQEVPEIIVVPRAQYERWMTFLDINPNKNLFEKIFEPKVQGGAFIPSKTYGPYTIPIGVSFVFNGPNNSDGYTAETIYEEMTHSILDSFKPQSKVIGEFWPNKTNGSGDFLEEGYAGVEKYFFMQEHHPEFFDNPKLPILQLKNHIEGKDVREVTNSTYPTILVYELVKHCGGDEFIELMRAARTNNPKALQEIASRVNAVLGIEALPGFGISDEFTTVCKLKNEPYYTDVMHKYIERLKDLPVTNS